MILIPGGEIEPLLKNEQLGELLINAKKCNCCFGAICAGVELLKNFNIMDDFEYQYDSDVFSGENYVMSKANTYVDIATLKL